MKILFDANVILDCLLEREPTLERSSSALREAFRLGHQCILSASSLNDIHYVVRKAVGNELVARTRTETLFSLFSFAKVDETVLSLAMHLQGRDFEDDIVVAAAIKSGADCIVTNNAKDFATYVEYIPVFTPGEFLDLLSKQ